MFRRRLPSLMLAAGLFAIPVFESAHAQTTAINLDGWERSQAATGTIYYQCRASTCEAGAAVSYRRQTITQLGPLAAFRAQHEDINQRMVAGSNGRIASARTIDASEDEEAGARVQTLVKAIETADGRREFMATSLVADGTRSVSIVSTARSESGARQNLRMFLPVVMLSEQLNNPAPAQR